ncbi:MAG: hypothetical protein Q4G46_06060, partial [Propionibacteriaceae bacterium]|nr:hypothetical protein [Propionibacteriaceae bacterium]
MTRQYQFRLEGHASAPGELLASDAIALIRAFKDLAYRLTRSVADRPGLGRANSTIEKLSTVRVSLREGSTRLMFAVGDIDAIVDPFADLVDRDFAAIVHGMATGERPTGIADSVAEAVDRLVVGLSTSAPVVTIDVPGHGSTMLHTKNLTRTPWQREHTVANEAVLHGTLEMVDLRSSNFRLRDSVGNAIDLMDVVDPDEAAHLVGERVTVSGFFVAGVGTHRHRMENPRIIAGVDAASRLRLAPTPELASVIAEARTVPTAPPLDLSDDEF